MNNDGLYASFLSFQFIHSIHGLVFCSSAMKVITSILILFVTAMKVSVRSNVFNLNVIKELKQVDNPDKSVYIKEVPKSSIAIFA